MITRLVILSRVMTRRNVKPKIHPYRSLVDSYILSILCRQLSFNSVSYKTVGRFKVFPKDTGATSFKACGLREITGLLKYGSVLILKRCMRQFELVIAHRIKRGQQRLSLYNQVWNENPLKVFLSSFRRRIVKNGKDVLFIASAVAFNWEKDRISNEELEKHMDELDLCHLLRKRVNENAPPCTGPECQCDQCKTPQEVKCWSPFINKDQLTVWKMEEKNHKGTGLFCYKMYGKYNDVLAHDFLKVFLDTENRKKWDSHAVTLEIVDSEPSTNSDVLYWETKWPKLFSNRDYIFTRRYAIDQKRQVMIIMNKSANHPKYPEYHNKSRVYEYWSYMVIKPLKTFDEEGIEFSLTYFDNPGVTLPPAISLWVTVTGMPEYLKTLRAEALKLAAERSASGGKIGGQTPQTKPAPPVESKPAPKKKEKPSKKKKGEAKAPVEKEEPKKEPDEKCKGKDEPAKDESKLPPKGPPCKPPSDPPIKQPLDPIIFWISC